MASFDTTTAIYVVGAFALIFLLASTNCVEHMVPGPAAKAKLVPQKPPTKRPRPPPPPRKRPPPPPPPKRRVVGPAAVHKLSSAHDHPHPLLSPSVHAPPGLKGVAGSTQKQKASASLAGAPVRR